MSTKLAWALQWPCLKKPGAEGAPQWRSLALHAQTPGFHPTTHPPPPPCHTHKDSNNSWNFCFYE